MVAENVTCGRTRRSIRAGINRALRDKEPSVRLEAVNGLETIGDGEAIAELTVLASQDESRRVRDRAAECLHAREH